VDRYPKLGSHLDLGPDVLSIAVRVLRSGSATRLAIGLAFIGGSAIQ
jgi:hypothetical protein